MTDKPPFTATELTRPFWDATLERRFLLQYDPAADRYQFYPRPISLFTPRTDLEWREASGAGTLVAVSLCHTPGPGFGPETPYILSIVRLREGPRVFARVTGAAYEDLRVGQEMRLVWGEERGEGREYLFAPAGANP
ncbi:Zn-ribbon domain-containing OB-fold protein [Enterovirga aerilata]|uniref:ChsH2 C-terminal OB-fold domain-containing protein n=1 Tax=Enterovirga aerilata TaxID=2730920 RepID=A0A849I8J8_9HYPH|nr:OB-fold domain-containing protein [Enterovirga sp. DB1703]NNM74114.1 hypothetical protein [Enterovirga sp. DB1703]